MSGVVGCDEEAFAGAGHEGPVASGLQVVVVGTQRVQLVQPSMAGLRPGVPVVVFDPGPVTALDRAGWDGPQQRGPLRGGRSATEVGDVHHVDAVGDDQFDDRFTKESAGHRHRDRPDAGDLAQFLTGDLPAVQRFDVDP
jgi:hypothetical protein